MLTKHLQMTIPDGALAGRKVIVLEPIQRFPFMTLPTELRVRVFDFVFPARKVLMKAPKRQARGLRRTDRFPSVDLTYHERKDTVYRAWVRRKSIPYSEMTVRINYPAGSLCPLLVSRQMFREAAPVLYDNTCFQWSRSFDPGPFIASIGSMRQHVTNMVLGDQDDFGKTVCKSIAKCINLRAIVVGQPFAYKELPGKPRQVGVDPDFVNNIFPLVKRLRATRAADAKDDVFGIIKLIAHC